MSDNFAISAGLGTSIATKDSGGAHHQKLLLEGSQADGTPELVGPTAPLHVIPAGKKILSRYLDKAGDGTGDKTGNEDFSVTPDDFYIEPGAGVVYVIEDLTVHIEGAGAAALGSWGDLSPSNGLRFKWNRSASAHVNLDDSEAITTAAGFLGLGAELIVLSGNFCIMRLPLARLFGGVRLVGDTNDQLAVTLNDDFSTMTTLQFVARGYEE